MSACARIGEAPPKRFPKAVRFAVKGQAGGRHCVTHEIRKACRSEGLSVFRVQNRDVLAWRCSECCAERRADTYVNRYPVFLRV